MKNKLIAGSLSLVYLIVIIVADISILKQWNYYGAVFINCLLTGIAVYTVFHWLQKSKAERLEAILEILNKSRYDHDFNETIKNENCSESVLTLIKGFNSTKEASKYVLKSSIDLGSTADHVAGKVNDMEVSAEQIAAASEEIVTGSLKQMEGINNIFSNIEKVGNSIEDSIAELKRIAAKTDESVKLTENGNEYVEKTIEVIQTLSTTMDEYKNNLNDFKESFSQIIMFADVIKEITKKTNLLALNSSIEAARAGEHGKGFAVVASEIGSLSKQSQVASEQISTAIHDMENKVFKLTEEISAGKERIGQGIQVIQKTEEAFKEISGSAVQTQKQVAAIGRHMEGIGAYADSVISSVETIKQVSEENAADCQEFSAVINDMITSFKDITVQSNHLKEQLNNLQQTIAKDTMDKYMYQKALDTKRYLEEMPGGNLKGLAAALKIDEIYIVDASGMIIDSSDPEGIGLDSFKIDQLSYEASKLKGGYRATPIRKRSHDDYIYKFLHIPYKNGMVITVSLSLQSLLSL